MFQAKDKPVLDEQALARLLEAAYVLQEHNRGLRHFTGRVEYRGSPLPPDLLQSMHRELKDKPVPSEVAPTAKGDYTVTLAQILETQQQIQARHLELDDAMTMVAARVVEIARANGAAIGLLDNGKIRYQAASGRMTLPVGAEVPAEKALSSACLRSGQVVRCENIDLEFLLDAEECRRRGIQSMIAVPVYKVGGVAGSLELYYAGKRAFTEHDVHSCQLMAGLITEALARRDQAIESSVSSDTGALADGSVPKEPGLNMGAAATAPFLCRRCGHELLAREQFCGKCGSPRATGLEPLNPEAMLRWQTPEVLPGSTVQAPANGSSYPRTVEAFPGAGLRIQEATDPSDSPVVVKAGSEVSAEPSVAVTTGSIEEDNSSSAGAAPEKPDVADWSSAATARIYLDELAARRPGALTRFWNARRGDFYLAISVVLVACALRWGIWSSHSISATGGPPAAAVRQKTAPDDDLSLFDRMLVQLGLAQAPEAEEPRGNPDVQVWVDLQTALYYCPGTDLYGKTPKGRFTTQRDAQLDQVEPAYRKACN